MHFKHVILLIAVSGTVAGCNWSQARWPWEKDKEIPLTEPLAGGSETDRDIATTPAPETYVAVETGDESPASGAATPASTTAAGFEEPMLLRDLVREPAPDVKPPQVEPTRPVVSGGKPAPLVKPEPPKPVDVSKDKIPADSEKAAPPNEEDSATGEKPAEPPVVDNRLKPSVIEDEPPVVEKKQPPVADTEPADDAEPVVPPVVEPKDSGEPAESLPEAKQPPVEVAKEPLVKPAPDTPPSKPVEPVKPEPQHPGDTEMVAASVLQVNDKYITVKEIMQVVRPKLAELPRNLPEKAFRLRAGEILKRELHFKIDNILVLEEASRGLTDGQNELLDRELVALRERLVASAGGSKTKLEADMVKQGTTLEEHLNNYRDQMVVRAHLHERFYKAIEIKPKDLRAYYRKHKSDFTMVHEVQMQIVAAPFRLFLAEGVGRPTELELKAAKAKAKELVTQAREAIKTGEEFDSVAKRLSRGIKADKGGYWPMMAAGSFREKKVEQAAFKLEREQVSEIIETDTGYFIVKAANIKPGKLIGFKDAQAKIADKLRQQEFNELVSKHYRRLYESATVLQAAQFEKTVLDLMVAEYYGK